MRELTSHRVAGLNEALAIHVLDEPGQGGACHKYRIEFNDGETLNETDIGFQNGPIKEFGVNGISQEALLAIVEDRLLCFQAGEYICHDNQMALNHVQAAMMWLQKRTRDRMARGVEGTNQK
jgi:hypothetical protein